MDLGQVAATAVAERQQARFEPTMGLFTTLLILALAVATAALANWLERRPPSIGQPPLVPWTAVQMVAVVVAILMLAHLVSMVTGTPLKSRFGF